MPTAGGALPEKRGLAVNLLMLAGTSLFCAAIVLEFVYRLRPRLVDQDNRGAYARLPLHDGEHHFCKGPEDRVLSDGWREYIERPDSEYFEYRDRLVRLHSHNEYGYRINEKNWSKRASFKTLNPTVWMFGDSFLRGTLADNTETIPAYLTKMNQDGVYFINFGIGGNGYLNALRHLQWAQHNLHHPPLAIIYIGHANDIADDVRSQRRLASSDALFAQRDKLPGAEPGLSTDSEEDSEADWKIRNWVQAKFPWLLSRWSAMIRMQAILSDRLGNPRDHLRQYRRSLQNSQEFFMLSKSITPRVFAFYIPSLYPDQPRSLNMQNSMNIELLQAASEKSGVPFLQLSHETLLEQSRKIRPPVTAASQLYGRLDLHLNEIGYFVAAASIARQLERQQTMRFAIPAQAPDRSNYTIQPERCP